MGNITGFIAEIRFKKTKALTFKPMEIVSTPVHMIAQARFGIKIDKTIAGIDNVLLLTGTQGKPPAGCLVFGVIFSGQKTDGNINGFWAVVFNKNFSVQIFGGIFAGQRKPYLG